jgi:hypothetical protein
MNNATPDPAGIFYATLSLYETYTKTYPNLSDTTKGEDQFVRYAVEIATAFEEWACQHVDFDEFDHCWPYYLHEHFGYVTNKTIGLDVADFTANHCDAIATKLNLPRREAFRLTQEPAAIRSHQNMTPPDLEVPDGKTLRTEQTVLGSVILEKGATLNAPNLETITGCLILADQTNLTAPKLKQIRHSLIGNAFIVTPALVTVGIIGLRNHAELIAPALHTVLHSVTLNPHARLEAPALATVSGDIILSPGSVLIAPDIKEVKITGTVEQSRGSRWLSAPAQAQEEGETGETPAAAPLRTSTGPQPAQTTKLPAPKLTSARIKP